MGERCIVGPNAGPPFLPSAYNNNLQIFQSPEYVAIFNEMTIDAISDLDLSYTPPLGSPWDALQTGAQAWTRDAHRALSARIFDRPSP